MGCWQEQPRRDSLPAGGWLAGLRGRQGPALNLRPEAPVASESPSELVRCLPRATGCGVPTSDYARCSREDSCAPDAEGLPGARVSPSCRSRLFQAKPRGVWAAGLYRICCGDSGRSCPCFFSVDLAHSGGTGGSGNTTRQQIRPLEEMGQPGT